MKDEESFNHGNRDEPIGVEGNQSQEKIRRVEDPWLHFAGKWTPGIGVTVPEWKASLV